MVNEVGRENGRHGFKTGRRDKENREKKDNTCITSGT